jgi:hypothetical protein
MVGGAAMRYWHIPSRGPAHSSRAAHAEAALGDLNIDLDLECKIPRRIDELHPRAHEQEFLVPLR